MLESLRFKHRISLLVGLASLALVTVTGVALLLARHGIEEVSAIETRYVPLLELKRDLETTFSNVTRTLENAASAAEEAGLRRADRLRDRFLTVLEAGEQTIADNGTNPGTLRREFLAYYDFAREVTAELVAGTAGEDLLEKSQEMHQAREKFASSLESASMPDRDWLAAAFDSARTAYSATVTVDVVVGVSAFLVMLVLSWWIVRHIARSLQEVTEGVNRLAHGDFTQEIQVTGRDELGELAREANQTAVRLREYRQLVEREDWVKTGIGGLAAEIAGELEPAILGGRAVTYLARYTGAVTAAAYATDEHGMLTLLESYGGASDRETPVRFAPGEGLIGQAARDGEVRLVSDLPVSYVIKSALGEATPRHLLIVPFSHEGRCMGAMELAFFDLPATPVLELMRRTRDALGIAFRVAESRMRVKELVEKMHKQAEELRKAYGTLKAQNVALQDSEQRLHRQQEELQSANDELLQTHVQLEEKASELTRANQYKSDFLASMSHELRTPLNSIMLLSRILAARDTDIPHAKQVEFAEVIFKSGDELLGLINDVLDLAKVEAGKQELVYSTVAIPDLAAYVKQMFEPLATQKKLDFQVELDEGLQRDIQADLMRLEQILKNLLSNAIKFTDQGQVTVRIFAPDAKQRETAGLATEGHGMVAISVRDTGPGIPREKQEMIFEAFAQAHTGSGRHYGGTGLGLAIARQLAVRMGGNLQVDSEPGAGSTFTVYVPTAEPRQRRLTSSAPPFLRAGPRATPHDTEPRASLPDRGEADKVAAAPVADALFKGKRLLIVDDDMRHVYSMTSLLQGQRLDIIAASDGIEAIEKLERVSSVDLILMDLVMPRMDGHETIRRIRQLPRFQDTPIIALTGRTGDEDRDRCMDAGASDFVAKPVDLGDLITVLNSWLGPRAGAGSRPPAAEISSGPES